MNMASSSLGQPDTRRLQSHPAPPLAASVSALPPAPSFATFQFKTIGQAPELLKRISAPDPDMSYNQDSERASRSSSSPDLSQELLPFDSPPHESGASRPSLHSRLSLFESLTGGDVGPDITMSDSVGPGPAAQNQSMETQVASPQTHSQMASESMTASAPMDSLLLSNTRDHHMDDSPSISMNAQPSSHMSSLITSKDDSSVSSCLPSSNVTSNLNLQPQPALSRLNTPPPADVAIANPAPSSATIQPPFEALHALQSRLSYSLTILESVNIANGLLSLQSAKDKLVTVAASAHRAQTFAQQALASAQESIAASEECLIAAETIQNHVDEALNVFQRKDPRQEINGSQDWPWNDTLKALKDGLLELNEWVQEREAQEAKQLRELEEIEAKNREKELSLKRQRTLNPDMPTYEAPSHIVGERGQSFPVQVDSSEGVSLSVEHEADAATRAWNQHREQSAERKRIAEEELTRRLDAEMLLEQEALRALAEANARNAELERLRTERFKAEGEEKARQEREAQELADRQHELERMREASQLSFAQKQARDNAIKAAAEEKQKSVEAEREKEARLNGEQDQQRRELYEREAHERRLVLEKAKGEAEREQQLRQEQEKKRQDVMAQKHRANAEAAAKILADRAKESQISLTPSISPPFKQAPLPSTPTTQNHSLLKRVVADFGNVVSGKTLVAGSPKNAKKQSRALSGGTKLGPGLDATFTSSPMTAIQDLSTGYTCNLLDEHGDFTAAANARRLKTASEILGHNATPVALHQQATYENVPQDHGNARHKPPKPQLAPLLDENVSDNHTGSLRNSSLPPISTLRQSSNSYAASFENSGNVHHSFSVHSHRPETGNIHVIPPSRVLPVSPEAQKANLRSLMHANGMSYRAGIKSEPNEQRLVSNSERSPVVPSNALKRSASQIDQEVQQVRMTSNRSDHKLVPRREAKLELPDDIPILSLPSPPASSSSYNSTQPVSVVPMAKAKANLSDSKRMRMSSTLPPLTILSTSGQTASPAQQASHAQQASPSSDLPHSPSLPAIPRRSASSNGNATSLYPQGTSQTTALISNVTYYDNGVSSTNDLYQGDAESKMGPDPAVMDGWAQPTALEEILPKRPRAQRRPGQGPRQALDHRLSPSISPSLSVNDAHIRLLPNRARPPPRGDHYSPPHARRTISPLPLSHAEYPRSTRGLGSGSNIREIPPVPRPHSPKQRDDISPDNRELPIGRKRFREDDQVSVPPARRYRYDQTPRNEFRPVNDSAGPPPSSSGHQYEDEWSRSAVYARSPSPEPTRATPLSQRLGSDNPPWNARGSSYRPNYGSSYYPSDSPGHRRYQEPYTQPSNQGSVHHDEGSSQLNSNLRHEIHPNDAHLPLLSRFTDVVEERSLPSSQTYPAIGKLTRPRAPRPPHPRSGGSQPLEQRISRPKTNVSLINRLQGAS
ncbi:hypothetical protein B0H34DRAFT_672861 [Crassisporium funariophilum]|nr:hypothetical protein B0H34DRAFT_672861 [Crassisporium funariophilum]